MYVDRLELAHDLRMPLQLIQSGAQMLTAIAVTFLLGNVVVKSLVGRDRPYQVRKSVEPLIHPPFDSSFPSGHTMNGFTAAVSLYCFNRRAGVPALFLASAIAFSRMYNLVHFPTDVLGGLVLGSASALGVDRFARRRASRRTTGRKPGIVRVSRGRADRRFRGGRRGNRGL